MNFTKEIPLKFFRKKIGLKIWSQKYPLGQTSWRPFLKKVTLVSRFWKLQWQLPSLSKFLLPYESCCALFDTNDDERRQERSPSNPTGSPHVIFQIWTSITKNIMLLSKKMWDTQPNPRYSAKNNDAIRMISSFMPNHYLMFCWSFLFFNSCYLRS